MSEPKIEFKVGQRWRDMDSRGPARIGEIVEIAHHPVGERVQVKWESSGRLTWVRADRMSPPRYELVAP